MRHSLFLVIPVLVSVLNPSFLFANTSSATTSSAPAVPTIKNEIVVADSQKHDQYIREGMIVGGDRNASAVQIRTLKHGTQKGFERFVLDIEPDGQGQLSAIERPPYFQVSIEPEKKRVLVTIFGKTRLKFDTADLNRQIKKSNIVERIDLLSEGLEPNRWSFAFQLKKPHPVEVVELTNSVRIVFDFQN